MNREELNLKRDEWIKANHHDTELTGCCLKTWDACADILLPEIERNKALVGYVRTNGHTIVETNAMADKITQLEKENADLKDKVEQLNGTCQNTFERWQNALSREEKLTTANKIMRDFLEQHKEFIAVTETLKEADEAEKGV